MPQRKRSASKKQVARKATTWKSSKRVAPRTPEQFFAKSERSQETWVHVTGVISKMRSGSTSLKQAAREIGVSPRTVIRLAASALKKETNGRYSVKRTDQLLRVLKLPTPDGLREIGVRGSRQASILGEYWAAVHKYLATGDTSGVDKFRGKQIKDSGGSAVPLITDLKELNRLGFAGVLSFESLYARSA